MPHVRRVQVIQVEGAEVLDLIPAYAPHVHAFPLDSSRSNAPVAELGGTSRRHDWAVSAAFVQASPRPVFLAGGLDATNVGEQMRIVAMSVHMISRRAQSRNPRIVWWRSVQTIYPFVPGMQSL